MNALLFTFIVMEASLAVGFGMGILLACALIYLIKREWGVDLSPIRATFAVRVPTEVNALLGERSHQAPKKPRRKMNLTPAQRNAMRQRAKKQKRKGSLWV